MGLCRAVDAWQCDAAVIQSGRHVGGWQIYRGAGVGGSRSFLYAGDIFDLGDPWTLSWRRSFFFDGIRKKRLGCLSKWFGHVIYCNRRAGTNRDGGCIFIAEFYYTMASGTPGNVCGYADLSGLRDGRFFCDIFI